MHTQKNTLCGFLVLALLVFILASQVAGEYIMSNIADEIDQTSQLDLDKESDPKLQNRKEKEDGLVNSYCVLRPQKLCQHLPSRFGAICTNLFLFAITSST